MIIIDIAKINRTRLKSLIKERYPFLKNYMDAANALPYFTENNRPLLSEQKITQALAGSSKIVLKDIAITFCELNNYPLEDLYKADEVELDNATQLKIMSLENEVLSLRQHVEMLEKNSALMTRVIEGLEKLINDAKKSSERKDYNSLNEILETYGK